MPKLLLTPMHHLAMETYYLVHSRLSAVYLEGFDERPQKCAYAFTTTQQLHQPHHTEQTEEVDADDVGSRRLENRPTTAIVIKSSSITVIATES